MKYIGQPVVNIVELNLALDKLDECLLRPDPDPSCRTNCRAASGEAESFFGACAGVGKTWAMLAEAASDCGRKGWILWLAW